VVQVSANDCRAVILAALAFSLARFFYQLLDWLVGFFTLILEGEGGILWVLLWTLLVVLLLARL
jgi:hypothetical protein